ncbi:MAG: SagB/ThcOx family dehydrogenase [Nitrospiraceae bacterium]
MEKTTANRLPRRSEGLTPREQVIRYHEETKHQFMRYARSLGYLDWANQPDPFRRYQGAPLFRLPLLEAQEPPPCYDDLYRHQAVTPEPLTSASLSRFLEYALSITAWKQAGEVRWALRSNPSSGNLHPTEGYVLIGPLAGLADHPALYHYAPKEHGLELRADVPEDVFRRLLAPFPVHSFLVGVTSVYWREAWKYGERAFRYCHHDTGHAIGSARISAASLGWRMRLLDDLATEEVAAVCGVARRKDFEGVEAEYADVLAVVWPAVDTIAQAEEHRSIPLGLDEESILAMDRAVWHGHGNRLSPDEPVRWDIIDEVSEATGKPRTQGRPREGGPTASFPPPVSNRSATAHQLIHQRRSAVAFDGKTSITDQTFFHMLERVMPVTTEAASGLPAIPWDVLTWEPRVHLGLFVHLVDGLAPGLYCLVRDEAKLSVLRQQMNRDFLWAQPSGCPPSLPLFCLAEGDGRRLAAQVSCHQEIAGASAFSLGMLAEFADPLQTIGPWVYPRLFWECGVIGQVLYLEAEAAGVRATGIGCFFDDPVHEVFGLKDRTFQSLYHFTVGGAVEDQRLTTLPPYGERQPKG